MSLSAHRRSIYGFLFAGAYGVAALSLPHYGLPANGMIAMGVWLSTYWFSRLTGLSLLVAYLVAAPLLQLEPMRFEDLRQWRGVFSTTVFITISVTGILVLHRLKMAQQRVASSERHLRLIAESTNDIILAYDMSRRLMYVNPAVEKLIGYTVEEMYSRSFR